MDDINLALLNHVCLWSSVHVSNTLGKSKPVSQCTVSWGNLNSDREEEEREIQKPSSADIQAINNVAAEPSPSVIQDADNATTEPSSCAIDTRPSSSLFARVLKPTSAI